MKKRKTSAWCHECQHDVPLLPNGTYQYHGRGRIPCILSFEKPRTEPL